MLRTLLYELFRLLLSHLMHQILLRDRIDALYSDLSFDILYQILQSEV